MEEDERETAFVVPTNAPGPYRGRGRSRGFPRGNRAKRGRYQTRPVGNQRPHGEPSHSKVPVPSVMRAYQRVSPYAILCSTQGLRPMCEAVFFSINFRDFRMAANVTLLQFEYVVAIAMYARLTSVVGTRDATFESVQQSMFLRTSARDITLPEIMCRYIETVGKVTLPNEVEVAPWFGTREEVQNPHFHNVNVDELLIAAGRPIPANYWSIDVQWIAMWNLATTRPSRFGMHFREIRWGELTGLPEMVVSPVPFQERGTDFLKPTAPARFTDPEMSLGAVYRFRDHRDLLHWPGQTALVCTKLFYGTEVSPTLFWTAIIEKSFTSTVESEK